MKNISIFIVYSALYLSPFLLALQPASAMTVEEFIKAFGVVDRYLQDIQRTFPSNPQPPSLPTETPNPAENITPEGDQPFPLN